MCLSVYVFLSVFVSVGVSLCLCVCQSVFLSFSVSIFVCLSRDTNTTLAHEDDGLMGVMYVTGGVVRPNAVWGQNGLCTNVVSIETTNTPTTTAPGTTTTAAPETTAPGSTPAPSVAASSPGLIASSLLGGACTLASLWYF
jgi:hypothetical protein